MQSMRIIRNPTGRLRPLSEASASEFLYHGGCIRVPGPYGDDAAKAEAAAKALNDSIAAGTATGMPESFSNFAHSALLLLVGWIAAVITRRTAHLLVDSRRAKRL